MTWRKFALVSIGAFVAGFVATFAGLHAYLDIETYRAFHRNGGITQ